MLTHVSVFDEEHGAGARLLLLQPVWAASVLVVLSPPVLGVQRNPSKSHFGKIRPGLHFLEFGVVNFTGCFFKKIKIKRRCLSILAVWVLQAVYG